MSSQMSLTSSPMRLLKDKLAKYGVVTGGIMVLVALLLIFFYLLYVVEPVFHGAEVEKTQSYSQLSAKPLGLGMEEQNEIAYVFTDDGRLQFFSLTENPNFSYEPGQILKEQRLTDETISSFAYAAKHKSLYVLGLANGKAKVVKPGFRVSFPGNQRLITPVITYPMGEATLTVDEQGRSLNKLAFEKTDDAAAFAAVTADGQVVLSAQVAEENFLSGEVEWSSVSVELPVTPKKVDELLFSPDLSRLFIRNANNLLIYDVRDITEPELSYRINLSRNNAKVTTLAVMSGASSLMVGYNDGWVGQWFEVAGDDRREFTAIRGFQSNAPVTAIYPEFYRKSFFTTGKDGQLGLFFTTSENTLWQGAASEKNIQTLAISPRSNGILTADDNGYHFFRVKNEHPEVTWSALWNEVWYEGYPEPDYIWQSTSASDDFESKFSLMPITFGTIKASLYAMLFAVPIALAAAVYTAYFMSPSMRKLVKPTIEIMEALPTVILGFLAGLWLAPLMEANLPGVVMLLLLLPPSIILMAFAWHSIPLRYRNQLPEGWDALLLVPIVLLVGWFAFAMNGYVEDWLFDGNVRQFITHDLGIDFDQRNALVVGIAMGFAVIPTIFSIAEDAVFSVPKHLSNGSLALGATQWQTLIRVVLLTASPGIFSAVMMGLGRAVGETMIVLMATGNTPIMDWSMFEGMRTLAANIAVEMPESEVGSSHYRILFLAAFVLFIFTFFFNTIAEFVRQRLRDKYSSL